MPMSSNTRGNNHVQHNPHIIMSMYKSKFATNAHKTRKSCTNANEIQRCWRLYEFCRAINGPDLLIRHVSSIWYS